MKTTATLESVRQRVEHFKSFIQTTTDNKRQFERNLRYGFDIDTLNHLDRNLSKHMCFVGKKVWKLTKSFNYSDVPNPDHFNPTNPEQVEFTEELFINFQKDYLNFLINRFTEELTERQIISNSTCKLTNFEFEVRLEEKQNLIKYFKELLYNL
jgi:hypothetical protein